MTTRELALTLLTIVVLVALIEMARGPVHRLLGLPGHDRCVTIYLGDRDGKRIEIPLSPVRPAI